MRSAAIAFACVVSFAAMAQHADARAVSSPSALPLPVAAADQHGEAAPQDAGRPKGSGKATPPQPDIAKIRGEAPRPRPDSARRVEAPRNRVCFNAAETREKITSQRLAEPFRALRAGRLQGEALRARLCRWKSNEFIYEVYVLRRDGRVVHVYMNAENGQSVGALTDSDLK